MRLTAATLCNGGPGAAAPHSALAGSELVEDLAGSSELCIDAGVGHVRALAWDEAGCKRIDVSLPSDGDLREVLRSWRLDTPGRGIGPAHVVITGRLAPLVRDTVGRGDVVSPPAAAWLAARDLLRADADASIRSLALIDLSASGYLLVGVDRAGRLKDDLLLVNPRCGAGSGINLDRVLQKLGCGRSEVDKLLARYAGEPGRDLREATLVRADRCGVFSSSATISDKNQGIPLDVALATTLKSEVLKACRKLPPGFDRVLLTGRVFQWRFARECAKDWLTERGVRQVDCDADNTRLLESLRNFARRAGPQAFAAGEPRLRRPSQPDTYPAMQALRRRYEADHLYLRLPDLPRASWRELAGRRLHLALDVGSTMAKAVLADADSGDVVWLNARSNSGDTIETVKQIFRDLSSSGCPDPAIAGVGITGSARYQVQQALEHVYPELLDRLVVLVENYAHARGSIQVARERIAQLKAAGVAVVNEDFCVLVDIGGEDTKVSTIALKEAELFGNAMNLKCSAGTGSLLDTLASMFGLTDVAAACSEAYAAPQAMAINATCAVFLMENARKLQLQGVPRDEILASANWAIVENMARTLWAQLELPKNPVVLLHGQTMLSEPLPVAVTHRLQSYVATPCYAVVPPHPGHRACLGLIQTLKQVTAAGAVTLPLARLIDTGFEKRLVQCRGAACEDKAALCNRSCLTGRDGQGRKIVSFTVGGCSAVNELVAKTREKAKGGSTRDTYKELWDFIDSRHPRSDAPDRIVIPRSFAVSEWAFLIARFLQELGLTVHVDNVRDTDLIEAQSLFNVDTCAPHMGAVGQFRRLAAEPHGAILAPQIERMPTGGRSPGLTCTLNQGGVGVAVNLARLAHPEARFELFNIDLSTLDPDALARQFGLRLQPLFDRLGMHPDAGALRAAAAVAAGDHARLRAEAADLAATMAEEAIAQGQMIAVAVGREYVLNPGIFDSHVRRLLRDKHLIVLPSYVLDLELNQDYAHIYWRNPHFIVCLLDAVSQRQLHRRLTHPRLRAVFGKLEARTELLPVVQVSSFCCGPDSVVQHFIAEVMRRRPFLLIQSDAIIKELAHLENRVNTYIKQLELRLHERGPATGQPPFEIATLRDLLSTRPLDPATDVIYFPTLADNRTVTATLRGAGYTCIDNYDDADYDLQGKVRAGRRSAGDAVCAPLAAVYADLERAVEDFARRRAAGDPLVAGKHRLLYFDNKGPGPCRQGQYFDVHRLLYHRKFRERQVAHLPAGLGEGAARDALVEFLVGQEVTGYNIGIEEWTLVRCHQGAVLQGVLQSLFFAGASACAGYDEYERFAAEFRSLKSELYASLQTRRGPSTASRSLVRMLDGSPPLTMLAKYFAYGLSGDGLVQPIARFRRRWIDGRRPPDGALRVALTGEVYMRVAQSEEIFRLLLANLGFRRFLFDCTPLWTYLEYLLQDSAEFDASELRLRQAPGFAPARAQDVRKARARIRLARGLQFALRQLVARPLYRAAGLALPESAGQAMKRTQALLPTLRPRSEIATYAGEAVGELEHGVDLLLNAGPHGCMVATMGEAMTPAIIHTAKPHPGRIQQLFSADGDVNEELLTLSVLKTLGPEAYYGLAEHPGPRENAVA